MMEEEIHFLVDEIKEELNKDIQSIITQINDPKAKQRVQFLNYFTRKLVRASVPVKKMPTHPRVHQQRTQELPLFKQYQPPQHNYKQPYYVRTVSPPQPVQEQIKPLPVQTRPKLEEHHEPKKELPPLPTTEGRKSIQETPSPLKETVNVELSSPPIRPQPDPDSIEKISLIKESTSKKTVVFAEASRSYYKVIEPPINDQEKQVLAEVRKQFHDAPGVLKDRVKLYKEIRKIAKSLGAQVDLADENQMLKLRYYLIRNIINFGKIEPLLHDEKITKIICEGVEKPIMIVREGKQYETNISFSLQRMINNLLLQMAQKTFQELSLDEPILDATYKEYHIQGTLGTDIVPAKFIISK